MVDKKVVICFMYSLLAGRYITNKSHYSYRNAKIYQSVNENTQMIEITHIRVIKKKRISQKCNKRHKDNHMLAQAE